MSDGMKTQEAEWCKAYRNSHRAGESVSDDARDDMEWRS
jgi:hypothetical protein